MTAGIIFVTAYCGRGGTLTFLSTRSQHFSRGCIVYFSQARLQGPRCELVEEEGPRGANEHSGEQAVQDVQRLRLRLLQRQRPAHRGEQVQELSGRLVVVVDPLK